MPRKLRRHEGHHAEAGQAPLGQYAPALKVALRATTARVQEMHHAVTGKTFGVLQKVPGVSLPARVVQGAHDAIANGVYAAVRLTGSAVLSAAGAAEAMPVNVKHPAGPKEQAFRSALNGIFGDRLADANNALAVTLGFYTDGVPLVLTPAVAKKLRPRVCVFIHGLACDEHSWSRRSTDGSNAGSYGDRLRGIGHMGLLNDPRAYDLIRRWLDSTTKL